MTDSYTSSSDPAVARAGGRASAEMLRTMCGQRLDRIDKAQGAVNNRLAQLLTCSHQARPVGEDPRAGGLRVAGLLGDVT